MKIESFILSILKKVEGMKEGVMFAARLKVVGGEADGIGGHARFHLRLQKVPADQDWNALQLHHPLARHIRDFMSQEKT